MSEYLHVEKPFLDQLAALGWTVIDQGHGVTPSDPSASLHGSFREWLLPEVFRNAVRAINRTADGKEWLKARKLIEGRRPNVFISSTIAAVTGAKAAYIKNLAFDKGHYKDMVLAYLRKFGEATRPDLDGLLLEKVSVDGRSSCLFRPARRKNQTQCEKQGKTFIESCLHHSLRWMRPIISQRYN